MLLLGAELKAGLEINAVALIEWLRWRQRFDAVHPLLLGQEYQIDLGLYLKTKVAEFAELEPVGVHIKGLHRHRCGATGEPLLMRIEVVRHRRHRRQHLHHIGEMAAVSPQAGLIHAGL